MLHVTTGSTWRTTSVINVMRLALNALVKQGVPCANGTSSCISKLENVSRSAQPVWTLRMAAFAQTYPTS